jgi:hypothetical protein
VSAVEERRRVRRALRRVGQGVTGNGAGGGGGRRRRPRVLVAGGLGLVVVVVGAVAVSVLTGSGGKETAAGDLEGSATATVARRDLVDTDSESGTLGYGDARTVVNRLNGTITWLPREGAVVRRGRTLYKVDAKPVILMYGGQPAYRTMRSGLTGADVLELERNLQALGYDPGVADGTYTDTTAAAVERWQDGVGLPTTGRVGLGRVVFLPGARRIGMISATLGGSAAQSVDGNGNGSSDSNASASDTSAAPTLVNAAYVVADDPTSTTPTTPSDTPTETTPSTTTPDDNDRKDGATQDGSPQNGNDANRQSTQPTTPSGSSSSASSASSGSGGSDRGSSGASQAAANTVMDTTSTTRLVTVDLDTTKQQLARKGERVEVELPSGDLAPGRISSVGKVAKAESSGDDQSQDPADTTSTLTVEIRLSGHPHVGDLDETPVTVRFAQETRRHALSVPVTALLATPGGHFAVVTVENGTRRTVPVEPGLSAGGYVEVSGSGIRAGLRVVDSASE